MPTPSHFLIGGFLYEATHDGQLGKIRLIADAATHRDPALLSALTALGRAVRDSPDGSHSLVSIERMLLDGDESQIYVPAHVARELEQYIGRHITMGALLEVDI